MDLREGKFQHRLLVLAPQYQLPFELNQLLKKLPTIALLKTMVRAEDVLEACKSLHPELLLVLTNWTERATLADVQSIHQIIPALGIIVVTVHPSPFRLAATFGAGARGYVTLKSIEDLPVVIQAVLAGGFAGCSTSAAQLTERVAARHPLSPREQLVAAQVAAGQTDDDIALTLGVKRTTIVTHVQNILRKIGGHSRVDIATWWMIQTGAHNEVS